jgi:3-oxoacyl-[acyl-carrier protein] reductase
MKLKDRVALVTGSVSGFGAATARLFASEGAAVVINYPTSDFASRGSEIVKEIRDAGGRAIAVQADVSEWDQVAAMVAKAKDEFGTVDILMNNAAVNSNTATDDLTLERWQRTIDVNLTGPFICVKNVLPLMVEQGRGNIINIASIAPWYAGPTIDYNASKAGLLAITRTIAKHYGRKGIRANTIAPGFHLTEMSQALLDSGIKVTYLDSIPVGAPAGPESIANAALYLASDDAKYVTGHTLIVDGGVTLL